MKYGYLYQGQRYSWQRKSRGTPTWGIPPAAFVNFIENHDQVANSDRGRRHAPADQPRALPRDDRADAARPGDPDAPPGAGVRVVQPVPVFRRPPGTRWPTRFGRAVTASWRQFPSLGAPDMKGRLPDPGARAAFERCRLDFSEREPPRGGLRAAPRPARAAAPGPGLCRPAAGRPRWRSPGLAGLRASLLRPGRPRHRPPAAREPRPRPPPPRRPRTSARAAGRHALGRRSGRAKTPATTVPARPRSSPRTALGCPAKPRSCWVA